MSLNLAQKTSQATTIDEALDGYLRLTRAPRTTTERKRLLNAIDDMRDAGVLIGTRDDTSRYTAEIVKAYVAHRPFPREISDAIIAAAPIRETTEVLDLAGGPGDLALALARASKRVSMMDLSKGFVNAAARRARREGLHLTPLHDSCNRLVYRDDEFDVVTISQALHWLDDVLVCKGLCRCLRDRGSFFVVHGAFEVDDAHPLAYLFGNKSILGHRAPGTFAAQADALLQRLTLLFEALDTPDVHRVDPSQQQPGHRRGQIVPASARLYRQSRPMDAGFARAFLTPQHIAVTGQQPDAFWRDLEVRCKEATPKKMLGTYHWAVLHFRRSGEPVRLAPLARARATAIGYRAPRAVSR